VVVIVLALPGDPWSSYYPVKLSWLLVVLLGMVALSLGVRGLLGWLPAARAAAAATGLVAALVIVSAIYPVIPRSVHSVSLPTARILSGSVWHTGDRAVRKILTLTGPGRLGLLWQSGDPDEGIIDYWLIISNGADLAGEGVARASAFEMYHQYMVSGHYDDSKIANLCDIVSDLSDPITVYSANDDLESELAAVCPSERARVVVRHSG
jgi:hypothetical protein